MGILPSGSCVSIIVWLHHVNFNKALKEKDRWELHKDVQCCFEQILEAAPHKAAATCLSSHKSSE